MFDEFPISLVKFSPEHRDMFDRGFISGSHVYIGRGSPLGNPYSCKESKYDVIEVETSEDAIKNFEFDLVNRKLTEHAYIALQKVKELSEKSPITLVCFCSPNPCHGESIRKFLKGDLDV